jgi:hypothetical protein
VEQLLELCFRGSGRGANQSAGQAKIRNPNVGGLSPHLYNKRKGGPASPWLAQPFPMHKEAGALPSSRPLRQDGAFGAHSPCHPEAAQAFAKRRPANEGSLHFHPWDTDPALYWGRMCGFEIVSRWTAPRREQFGVYPMVRSRDVG